MPEAPKALLTRAATFETRATDDGFTLEGYAAVFGSTTRIDSWEGTFDERIARNAFTKTLKERTPVMQFDHGHDIATGSVPIAAIDTVREDKHGLFVSARMFDNPRVEPIRQAIAGGAIDGMSFRFRVTREEWDETGDVPLRTIRELELFELGPVVFPAYAATSVGVRSLLADLDEAQQSQLLADISGADAARTGTSTPPPKQPDAAHEGTSGTTGGRDPRAALHLATAMRLGRKEKP
jgi:HK97 family phage prohead protease